MPQIKPRSSENKGETLVLLVLRSYFLAICLLLLSTPYRLAFSSPFG